MKRFLGLLASAFFVLAGWQAEASVTTTGAGKKPTAGSAYVGVGDLDPTYLAWWSLRAYDAAHADGTHAAIHIIRASDSKDCDVLLAAVTGDLGNVASCTGGGSGAVATFCAATTCKISVFYDQTGNGHDRTQSTGSLQATLSFSCVGGKPCAVFTAGQAYASTIGATGLPFTIAMVSIRTSNFMTEGDILTDASGGFYYDNAVDAVCIFLAGADCAPASDNVWHAMQIAVTGSSSLFQIDATPNTRAAFGSGLAANVFLGAKDATPTDPMYSNFVEGGEKSGANSGTLAASITHNQCTYWGLSC